MERGAGGGKNVPPLGVVSPQAAMKSTSKLRRGEGESLCPIKIQSLASLVIVRLNMDGVASDILISKSVRFTNSCHDCWLVLFV